MAVTFLLLFNLKLRFLFLNKVYQWYSSSCGSWISAWIQIIWSFDSIRDLQKQQSEVRTYGTCCFSYTRRLFTFFLFLLLSLAPFFLCSPHFFHFLAFFYCPSFSFCHLISDCLLLFHFVLSVPTVSSSSGSFHLLHHHQIGFSAWVSSVQLPPELPVASGAASLYTLMMRLQTGKSRKSWEKVTPKTAGGAWWQGAVTALCVIIWQPPGLAPLPGAGCAHCLLNLDTLCYHIMISH